MVEMLNEALLEQARGLSSATLHEAAGKIGALPSRLRPIAPGMQLCGRALPVACPPGDNLFLHHAIYEASPGDVLVVDTAGGIEFGYWGGIMATAAQVRGLAGLVITGGVRDSAAMAQMGFAVFSQAVCIQGTAKDQNGAGTIGEPVTICGTRVCRGDLVFADDDGAVVVPAGQAEAVVAASIKRDADEEAILRRLRAGETTLAIYGLPDIAGERPAPTTRRRSIHVAGLSHGALPIPAASRIGGLLATGGVRGVDAAGKLPADVQAQADLMFDNLRTIVEAAGLTCGDIVKLTIWIASPEGRAAVNGPWVRMFPDSDSRPARHILAHDLPGGMLVQCEALAVGAGG